MIGGYLGAHIHESKIYGFTIAESGVVMKPALKDITFLIFSLFTFNLIYKAVLAGDAAGPASLEIIFERLGLAYALEGGFSDVLEQFLDFYYHAHVSRYPVAKLLPGILGKLKIHFLFLG